MAELWFECNVPMGSCVFFFNTQSLAIEFVEPLGGGASLKEVGHWGWGLRL